jgi:hypothetical protein
MFSGGVVWGVSAVETWYEVKTNGAVFDSYPSDTPSKITFSSGILTTAKTFSLEIDTTPPSTGGSAPLPRKPGIDKIKIFFAPDGDTGTRKIVGAAESYDADSVYEINAADRDSYRLKD